MAVYGTVVPPVEPAIGAGREDAVDAACDPTAEAAAAEDAGEPCRLPVGGADGADTFSYNGR